MPTVFATTLIEQVGPVDGYLHVEPVSLDTPTTVHGNFATVNRYEPWSDETTAAILQHHPLAVWRHLTARISSREGSHGRMVTLYGGWSAAGAAAPANPQHMMRLRGAIVKTFGGTGDPGMFNVNIPCPFDGTISDVLKAPYNAGVRPVFYYAFTEVELTASPPEALRASIDFDGHFDVYGRY